MRFFLKERFIIQKISFKNSLFNFITLYILFVMGWFDQVLNQLISFRIFLPFIPLFVAFNALGILPIFASLTTEMSEPEQKKGDPSIRLDGLFS